MKKFCVQDGLYEQGFWKSMSFVYPTLLLEKLFGRVKDCQDFPRLDNEVSQKNHESQILSDQALFPKIWDTEKVGNFIWLVEAITHSKEFSKKFQNFNFDSSFSL